jgi:TRAP-type C4-dicarboxylate transport system substrate-binding protein
MMPAERPRRARSRLALAAALAILSLTAAACGARSDAAAAAGKTYVLRYASPYPPTHPFSRADIAWMKEIERRSGGRLKVQPFWGGTLISSDSPILELRHGVADVALITPIYMRGGAQAIKLQAGFYAGARTPADQVVVYRCLQRDFPVLRDEVAGLKVLAIQGGNLPNVLTRDRPVTRLDDFKGLRLRTPTENAPVLRRLGADPVTMSMAEVYSALSKGVVDGVLAPADTVKSLHFSEVTHYLGTLEVARGGYPARAISDQAWNRLPADLQAMLAGSETFWEAQLNDQITRAEADGIKFGATHGIKTVAFDPAEQERFNKLANQITLETATRVAPTYGPAMFRRAQDVVSTIRAGKPEAC